ncbi:bifunctional glutamate N-acetyltransferase/amino-acid acetyltransferase ArgJ [Teredinibacter turnerae]|uniref:bifunctional glutamate N-acetyltransferase/amino-acid acetyltransferase ArgJ n=1 Tax=Teredinibacter turnerae TaxID=2426 RepID=UPI00036E1BDC|nr:bifunctional glutamate N-acetyltransferase/amino-acid acetyltransferase ArgJ [Teredinibacter turnerae]
MAVGEFVLPDVRPVAGVRLGVSVAGIKQTVRPDCVLIALNPGTRVAGVFTQNAFCAAPVTLCRQYIGDKSRYLLINSGNANACTGDAGMHAARLTMAAVAAEGDVAPEAVLPFSTGVIGNLLPAEKIVNQVPSLFADLAEDGWQRAARAIMTTDTRPKLASKTLTIAEQTVTITGMSKGAGMIKPNMATMLGFIATDAVVSQSLLEDISRIAANQSFNRITIDGDTSTNDSCILMATAAAGHPEIVSRDCEEYGLLLDAVCDIYQSLAQQIVRDGEGATKFVTVEVKGGATNNESLTVAYAIAHSPLIKTALFASDPNWGRIVAAIGYADVPELDASKVKVWLDEVQIVADGGCAAGYTEEAGQAVFNQAEFAIRVDLGRGECIETIWTSDLSHEYVTINAEYRT